jgi:outer membrane protein assembly factor BamE (lipoprotein component of BamABCDE complex)
MKLRLILMMGILGIVFTAVGCSEGNRSSITPGAAKKYITIGTTTQAEVIEIFGTPNIITQKSEGEVWVYDKVSSNQTSSAFGAGGLGGGGGAGGFGGGLIGGGVSSSTRSETTVMLIIYFDGCDVVTNYKIKQTKF